MRISRRRPDRFSIIASAIVIILFVFTPPARAARQQISEDRDLKENDLKIWPCLNQAGGSAKTPDGMERNRLKNRTAPDDLSNVKIGSYDFAGFLKHMAEFESGQKNKKRKDMSMPDKQKLEPLEQEMASLTGYLVLAYCGPPESTNCGSGDFHDWHLEVFEKPMDHPPGPGDPTPIICEITPRTQNAIYKAGIRIQELAGFFRHPDMTYEPTGHPARKIRLTGYLLWDDEHNGTADVGKTVERVAPQTKYHNPWREIAWELHPVFKIEPLEGVTAKPADHVSPPPAASAKETASPGAPPQPSAAPPSETVPALAPTLPPEPTPTATPAPQQFVTITQAVKLQIPYGETMLPRGTKVPIAGHDARTVTIKYAGTIYNIPISSTDFQP